MTVPDSRLQAAATRALGNNSTLLLEAQPMDGAGDAVALWQRYGAQQTAGTLLAQHPLLPAMEKARALACGGGRYRGAAQNMLAWYSARPATAVPEALQALLIALASDLPPPERVWHHLPPAHWQRLQSLLPWLDNPAAFARQALLFLQGMEGSGEGMPLSEETSGEQNASITDASEEQATTSTAGQTDSADNDAVARDATESSEDDAAEPETLSENSEGEGLADDARPSSMPLDGEGTPLPAGTGTLAGGKTADSGIVYHVYTTAYDQTVTPAELSSAEELQRLRQQMDKELADSRRIVQKLANRLQRQLLAQQQRFWHFDQEEGILDTRRLARLVASPGYPLMFRREDTQRYPETAVTLLLDNSGSMRGKPILMAAMAADILARTLERCQVTTEVLGFTTATWKGGRARTDWMAAGRPPLPGRMNEIRHLIYKGAHTPYRRCRTGLALMLKEGILKENIDGEALLWAHQRLMALPQPRKLLVILSDGAPVDDATLSSNHADILEQHLRQVIATIENHSPVELFAIGIGHDVTRYYRRAITLKDSSMVGDTLLGVLGGLFA